MTTELQVQADLVSAVKLAGGFGFKSSNAYTVGVADLSLQLPPYPHMFLEIKFLRGLRRSCRYPVALTPHQRKFIREVQEAGGVAGWLLAVEVKKGLGRIIMQVGIHPDAEHTTIIPPTEGAIANSPLSQLGIVRERGGPWPIQTIMDRISRGPA